MRSHRAGVSVTGSFLKLDCRVVALAHVVAVAVDGVDVWRESDGSLAAFRQVLREMNVFE